MRAWPLFLLLLSLPAPAGDRERPTLVEPFPFLHHDHKETFEKAGINCQDCHGVGLPSSTKLEPRLTCHGCHRQQLPGAPRSAARTCDTCHPVRAELMPDSHDTTWLAEHGGEARLPQNYCMDCHVPATCVNCHDRRGAQALNPHPAGFRGVHGIEARLDPATCNICHAPSTCTSCHEQGGLVP